MTILLARKAPTNVPPVTTDDDTYSQLVDDPTMPQFPSYNNEYQPSRYNTQILTGTSGSNAASESTSLVAANEHWVNSHWRPVMGWSYLVVCTFDFLIAPILWSIFQAMYGGNVTAQWQPVTLQGAGLYHIAMGTIMGITSYGRTREKIEGVRRLDTN